MSELTNEQLEAIDTAVIRAMGHNIYEDYYDSVAKVYYGKERLYFVLNDGTDNEVRVLVRDWSPTRDYRAWAKVEKFMVDKFTRLQKAKYVAPLYTAVHGEYESYIGVDESLFSVLVAPLPIRCLAFLKACGKDIDEIVKVKE